MMERSFDRLSDDYARRSLLLMGIAGALGSDIPERFNDRDVEAHVHEALAERGIHINVRAVED